MTRPELAHLELLAEMDSLTRAMDRWADAAPDWQPADTCRALAERLRERAGAMRVRLEAPLIVATLGGTGTGKSALVNALVGAEVTSTGKSRPTTQRPKLICRPDLTPKILGIDPGSVELVHRDLPGLAELVIVDCPDPDTTEETESAGTNLSRLRAILPHCDVLVIATTQQKYRSARVAHELATAAAGARLVFVQTHADEDEDIRDDWRAVLEEQYTTGHIFLVDSLGALEDAREGRPPRGEFAALVDLLTRQLAGTAPVRIRQANYLDLVADTLDTCRARIEEGMPAVRKLEGALAHERMTLAGHLADQMRSELLASRRQWEMRLVGKVASRWGFSPLALVLRIFQGIGGLLTSALLLRARTPAQVALWGVFEAGRNLQRFRGKRRADLAADRAVADCWDQGELRQSALVVDGYAAEAGLDRRRASLDAISAEAAQAGASFVSGVSTELESLLGRVAQRHSGLVTRWIYEIALAAMLVVLLVRPAKNFFYDSWLASPPAEVYGLNFYVLSLFWLLLWCMLLLWCFTTRLRRGLRSEITQLSEGWKNPKPAAGVFASLESQCRHIDRFAGELERLRQHVAGLKRRLALPDEKLGQRRS
jgi:hypothetical protein